MVHFAKFLLAAFAVSIITQASATFVDDVNSLLNQPMGYEPIVTENLIVPPQQRTFEKLDTIVPYLEAKLSDRRVLYGMYHHYAENWNKKETMMNTARSTSAYNGKVKIFKDNILNVVKHNVLARQGEYSYEMGINQFTDMTKEEIERYVGYLPRESYQWDTSYNQTQDDESGYVTSLAKRDKNYDHDYEGDIVNWCTKGYVTPAKDQKDCGSCVFFAVAGLVESAYLMKHGKKLDLSEQEFLDCAKEMDGYWGCEGNWPKAPLSYLIGHGISLEADYPYKAKEADKCGCKGLKHSAHISDWKEYDLNGDEERLQKIVKKYGPIAIVMEADDEFPYYSNGVYESKSCGKGINHAVLAVGYGTTKKGVDYWIVKNSWGNTWGDKGFFRIRRNANNMCGIAEFGWRASVK